MRYFSSSLLTFGVVTLSAAAQAQTWVTTTPDGTTTRTTISRPQNTGQTTQQSAVGLIAGQAVGTFPSADYNAYPNQAATYCQPSYGYGSSYYGQPYYGSQTYTYPGAAYSGPLAPTWGNNRPVWITSIPLGGTVTTTYGSPYPCPQAAYPPVCAPAYPTYPAYPYPVYGSPFPGYSYSSSQSTGYGVTLGNGGVSVSIGGGRTTTTRR